MRFWIGRGHGSWERVEERRGEMHIQQTDGKDGQNADFAPSLDFEFGDAVEWEEED